MRELLAARRRAGDRARRRRARRPRRRAALRARARALRVARRAGRASAGSASTALRARGRSRATGRRFEQLARERAAALPRRAPTRSSRGEESAEVGRRRARAAGLDARRASPRPRSGEGAVAIVDPRARRSRAPVAVIELEGGEDGQVARRRWSGSGARSRSASSSAATWSCAPAAARSPTSAASPRPRSGAACPGSPCPSTLVGQVDAAIGGKTAINVAAKNDVGAFWQPRRCSATPRCWRRCRRASGRAAWPRSSRRRCSPADACGSSSRAGSPASASSPRAPSSCSAASGVKTLVVAADPEDRGRRAILNLGHTIGHGIESVAGYGGLSHGECVVDRPRRRAAPLRGASPASRPARPSARRGCCERHGLPVRAPGLDSDGGARARCATTRSARAGTHRMVLLEAIGRPVYGVARRRAGARRRGTRRHRSPLD